MSVYGSQFDTTPNLSAEAEHAMVMDRGYAQSGWTYLSRQIALPQAASFSVIHEPLDQADALSLGVIVS
jgi:uncharacterized lipoprotein YbaY